MDFVFPPPQPVAIPVAGRSAHFPVRRVYCVGRNYAAHAREMGSDPTREPPFFFGKPADAVVPVADGQRIDWVYPGLSRDVHPEIELVVAVGRGGRDIPAQQALDHVFGYAVGLDMTRRDLQAEMKKAGRPWEIGKAFDASAPIGPIHAAADIDVPKWLDAAAIELWVNDERRQSGRLADLIWSVPETLAHLSRYFALQPGDLVFTGTPEGVAAVRPGDLLQGRIDGLGQLRLRVVAPL